MYFFVCLQVYGRITVEWGVGGLWGGGELIGSSLRYFISKYRKIPKISPGAKSRLVIGSYRGLYFSKALYKGLIFGGAYLRRDICVSKLIWLAL